MEKKVMGIVAATLITGLILGFGAGYFSLAGKVTTLQKQVSTLQDDLSERNSEISNLQTELDEKTSVISDLENQVSTLESDKNALQNQVNDLQDRIGGLEIEKSTLQSQITSLQNQISQKDSEIESLEDEITELQDQLETLEKLVPSPPPSEGEPGYSRFFPASLNTNITVVFTFFFETYTARITVTELIRGDEAWSMVQDANMFNDPPKEGYEYIVAKIRFELLAAPTAETSYSLSSVYFDAVSETGRVYESADVVDPDPSIDVTLYPRASHEGWCTFAVGKTDLKPVMAFGVQSDGTGGVWFQLYGSTPAEQEIKISIVSYDPPGDDRDNLNGEYVTIENTGSADIDLTGWTLSDEVDHTFTFPSFVLQTGKKVTIHTGSGTNDQDSLYWGMGSPVWNNDHDTAYLRDADGELVDSYQW